MFFSLGYSERRIFYTPGFKRGLFITFKVGIQNRSPSDKIPICVKLLKTHPYRSTPLLPLVPQKRPISDKLDQHIWGKFRSGPPPSRGR